MKDIGQEIQQARLAKGVTLEEIAGHTHIQLAHLQKIENGQFDFLPRPYVVAFIKTFAQHVGLNGEMLVKRWREQVEVSQHEEQQGQQSTPHKDERKTASVPLRPPEVAAAQSTSIPYLKEIAIGFGMIVVMAGLIYVMSQPGDEQAQNGRDDRPSSVQSSSPSRVQEIPFSQVSKEVAARTQTQEQAPATTEELALQAQFERQTRVRLIRDGSDTSIAVYRAAETQTWRAKEKFNLRLSVAGSVTLSLDGKGLGKFGQAGQIEYITITSEGVINRFAVTPKPRTTAPRDSVVVRSLDDLGPRRRN